MRDEVDFKLRQFAIEYIKTSNNVENLRGKGDITRVSVERLCAGPAVPLIYAFLKQEYPDVESPLSESIQFDAMTSGDIIRAGMSKTNPDPLCKMVVAKFAEILATALGNTALNCIPYGGIYMVGGVTTGIQEFIEHDSNFLATFYEKGRLQAMVRRVPLFIVRPEVELGILGAEECAFRELGCFSV